jgi:murein DD-endopeptidase MepM/ murein hydrolase activator NlpD
VVRAVDGQPDQAPATRLQSLEGNHVILACDGVWIVLAHLMQASVRVAKGSEVPVGDVLGRVGNSGASDEPHLHIHAQTPGTAEAPLGGEPLPVTFDGRHLVRNDRVRGS